MCFRSAWLVAMIVAACAGACAHPGNSDNQNKTQANRGLIDTGAGGGGGY